MVPVKPYNSEQPNNNKPEEKAPSIKYFKPASVENSIRALKKLLYTYKNFAVQ